MSAHSTTQPAQVQTDTYMVFGNIDGNLMLVDYQILLGKIEVPKYTRPNSDGTKMSEEKRQSLAVNRVVSDYDGSLGVEVYTLDDNAHLEGTVFGVMKLDGSGEIERVPLEFNPSFDAVWNPEAEQ